MIRRLASAPVIFVGLTACVEPGASTSSSGMSTVVGECSNSIVTEAGRLEGVNPHESGSDVSFAHGGYQVSYEPVASIIGSRVGDPVRICLVSIPTGCPPGDGRGRIYATTNLRTGESWQLPDASHLCGGA